MNSYILESENENGVKIVRRNDTTASVIYRPTKEDQLRKSKEGLQGQFVVQYDIDRSTIEKKGGEIHVSFLKNIYFYNKHLTAAFYAAKNLGS